MAPPQKKADITKIQQDMEKKYPELSFRLEKGDVFSISVKADPFLLRLGKKINPIKLSATTGAVNAMSALATDFFSRAKIIPVVLGGGLFGYDVVREFILLSNTRTACWTWSTGIDTLGVNA